MANPDGRPWWDIPKPTLTDEVDYTYDKSQAEMEQERVAQHAIDAAMSMIQKGDPKIWAEPTPQVHGFIAPHVEKGFHEPQSYVPGILQDAYRNFSEMYALLAGGASPSDPEVVKRSTEVAGALVGVGGGGGEAVSVGSGLGGKIVSKLFGKKSKETLESLGIDKDFQEAVSNMGLFVDYDTKLQSIALSGGDMPATKYFGKDTAALEDHLVKLEMGGKVVNAENPAKTVGSQGAPGTPSKSFKEPIGGQHMKGFTSKDSTILAQFDTKEEALAAYNTMAKAKGIDKNFGTPEAYNKFIEKEVFQLTDSQDKITGKWAAFHIYDFNIFEKAQPLSKFPKSSTHDYGDIKSYASIKVNDQLMTWHDFISFNKDSPEIVDLVKTAHAGGVGHIMWGGGAIPEITIKVPLLGKPPAGAVGKRIKAEHLPTEMEMSRWPDAKVIDKITIDEAHPGPIIAYHGTRADHFINFDLSKSKDIGIHFGTKEQAGKRTYSGPDATTSRIIPAHIDVKNPLELPDLGGWYPAKIAEAIENVTDIKGLSARIEHMLIKDYSDKGIQKAYESLRNTLNKQGYDSIRYQNTVEGEGWSYIVWQKGKVKSATNPDHILYAGGPGPLPKDRYAENEDGRHPD